ncbi:biliverdin-producing heme oxygenase [Cellulomonas sp. NPDC089187]|uniref:biliverdin-producing heme oxygenase n=1 Tax=Cellulomonas sp. NPDC089187 TaxID=3154970 RepID=UPI00342E1A39
MTTTAPRPTVDPTCDGAPLSALLRASTRDDHQAAESMPFIDRLLAGELSAAAYADLAAQLVPVYQALEEVGDQLSTDPIGASIVFEELRRTPSLAADLAALVGPEWADRPDMAAHPATTTYVARIRSGGLPGYVAHAYTRYLGDLSGGQVIARMVQRHYGVPEEALSFYRFAQIDRIKPFKDVYRERMDALPLTAEQRAAVVAESREAFRANRELFAALGARHLG